MGAVLMQDESDGKRRIILVGSAKFLPTEAHCHCDQLECVAIVWAIKRNRPFFGDRPYSLRTVSNCRFPRTIELVPGKENKLPDALSRDPNPHERSLGESHVEQMLPPITHTGRPEDAWTVPVLSDLARLSFFP